MADLVWRVVVCRVDRSRLDVLAVPDRTDPVGRPDPSLEDRNHQARRPGVAARLVDRLVARLVARRLVRRDGPGQAVWQAFHPGGAR